MSPAAARSTEPWVDRTWAVPAACVQVDLIPKRSLRATVFSDATSMRDMARRVPKRNRDMLSHLGHG